MNIYNGPVVNLARRPRAAKPYEIKASEKKNEAEVYLYDDIGDSWEGTTGKQFAADLKAVGDIRLLNIYINSPGGAVFDGVAIYNVLKRHRARKVVHIDGVAASIASVVAMAGDEIQIAMNGMIMIHDPWAMAAGTAEDFRKMATALDKVSESILATYVERTGTPQETLAKWMAEETWFTAEEAVEAGLADMISDEVEMAAFSRLDISSFRNAPDALKAAVAEAPTETESDDLENDSQDDRAPHSAVVAMTARVQKRGLLKQA